MTSNDLLLAAAARLPAWSPPDFSPSLPPGLDEPVRIGLGWLAAILITAAVGFMIVAGIKVMRARQTGSGNEGLDAVGRTLGGLIIGLAATGIVSFLVSALL